jgi:uncharacterized membrane protein
VTYPSEPSNYPAYPAQSPVQLRGRRPIQVGGILMAVGLVLIIVGAILANTNAYSKVNGFQRVPVSAGSGTVTFDKAGGYVAYYESSSVTSSTNQKVPEIPVQLTNQATGQQLVLTTPYGNRSDGKIKFLHYDHGGHRGVAMWQFHIDQPGTYHVVLGQNPAAASDATVAFGKSIAQGVVLAGAIVIVGVLLLIGGLITLIVGLVKRRRHKQELRTAVYGGGQPPAWPQQNWPQQQTWPQQGGSQQTWPQQGGSQQQTWPQQGGSQQTWPQQSAPEQSSPPQNPPQQSWPPQNPPEQNWPPQNPPQQSWPPENSPDQGWPQQNWPPSDR